MYLCICHIVYGVGFWLIKVLPTYLFHYILILMVIIYVGFSCGRRLFSWGLGLPKSCRQVDFLCLPIWMGSYPWRYSHSSKILFDDLSENIIYYRGISPGKPALLPTGTSVSSPGRFDWSDGGVHLPANLGTIVWEPEEVDCLPSPLGILVQGLGGSPSPPPGIFPGCLKIFYLDFGGFFLSLFFSRDAIISPLLARLLWPISAS